MATYAVGDIQGCWAAVQRLMNDIRFEPGRDRLWLVGDLVNRGPDSLSVLRWVKSLGDAAVMVLGNHDLHLLARIHGVSGAKKSDTLDSVLTAADRDQLAAWLLDRPLLHREDGRLMVHAGLLPAWTVGEAEERARHAEAALQSNPVGLLRTLYAGAGEGGLLARAIETIRVLTRLRACTPDGQPDFQYNKTLEELPAPLKPWFDVPGRRSAGTMVIFGHWAALGFRAGENFLALDSGCVWGHALTAVRLEDSKVFQVGCA